MAGAFLFQNGSGHFPLSTSFLTTSRRLLQYPTPNGSAAGEPSETPSSPTSPPALSSQTSSSVPSPVRASNPAGSQLWSLGADLNSSRAATLSSAPSPSALQDSSSQDTQSSGTLSRPIHKWNDGSELLLLLLLDDLLVCKL